MKRFIPALAAVAATLSLAQTAFAAEAVTFMLDWLPAGDKAAVYLGVEKGLFEAEGIKVTVQSGRGSSDVVTKLATGTADMGTGGLAALLQAAVLMREIAHLALERIHRLASALAAPQLHLQARQQHRQQADQHEQAVARARGHRSARQRDERIAPGIHDAFERLAEAMGRLKGPAPANVLTVSTGPAFAAKWLSPRLHKFLERYPEMEQALRRHIEETHGQRHRLEEALQSLGDSPSTLKEGFLGFVGNMMALGHTPAQDEILKNTYANHAFENFEIAAYESLLTICETAGQQGSVTGFQQSLREEEAMARKVRELVGPTSWALQDSGVQRAQLGWSTSAPTATVTPARTWSTPAPIGIPRCRRCGRCTGRWSPACVGALGNGLCTGT